MHIPGQGLDGSQNQGANWKEKHHRCEARMLKNQEPGFKDKETYQKQGPDPGSQPRTEAWEEWQIQKMAQPQHQQSCHQVEQRQQPLWQP
jgi:hypothetical protein